MDNDLDDHFHDQCGVFGIFNNEEASNLTYLGLHALQHRGQESAGIVSSNGEQLFAYKALGLVNDCFDDDILKTLPGNHAIGHVRYSTAGESHVKNAQPIAIDYSHGSIAVAHNGNLTNAEELKSELEFKGSIFQTTSDTEILLHLIARSRKEKSIEKIVEGLKQIEGAFSLLLLTPNEMIAVRDPWGFRPLCIGRLNNSYVFASEPPAFELIAAEYIRDVEPGEVVILNKNGLKSLKPFKEEKKKMCIFEHVYFSRPDSTLNGINIYEARKRMGVELWKESPCEADVIIPVPDSGIPSAMGYSQASGMPFDYGLIRSHYVGRTFIEPSQNIRHFGVRLKLSPNRSVIQGKEIVVIDDSIVRGTTSRKIVKMLRDAGAKKIHLRISSPPIKWPCFYGIDTPSRKELIASNHSINEIAKYTTADTIEYLSIKSLFAAVGGDEYCDACFTGNYPVSISQSSNKKLPITKI